MIEWASRWVWWIVSRCTITLVCIVMVQALLKTEGYHVAFKTLVVGAACLITGVCVWMRGPRPPKPKKEITWSGYTHGDKES